MSARGGEAFGLGGDERVFSVAGAFAQLAPLEFRVAGVDGDVAQRLGVRPDVEAAPAEVACVLETLEPWDGPQRPRAPASWWRWLLGYRRHRRAVQRWRVERDRWVAAGRPPRRVRRVIPRARIVEALE